MPDEKRRVLTAEEKAELLEKHKVCYICLEPLANYGKDEIEFDHIYSYADGNTQELSNFAPVHASADPLKKNCHLAKGRKSPHEYREEVRITNALSPLGWFSYAPDTISMFSFGLCQCHGITQPGVIRDSM